MAERHRDRNGVSSCCARSAQMEDYDQCPGIVDIKSPLLRNASICSLPIFETVADNLTYCSIPTHIAFPKQRFSPSVSVHSLD